MMIITRINIVKEMMIILKTKTMVMINIVTKKSWVTMKNKEKKKIMIINIMTIKKVKNL